TGGRLKRVREYLKNESMFAFTYGDGVANINISEEIEFHKSHGKMVTVAAVQPPGRYGALDIDGTKVMGFAEKPKGDGGWVNGGFFILSPAVIDFVKGDETPWETTPLETAASNDELRAYFHDGFWQPMDTLREKNQLEDLWQRGKAPWKVW
ncbi:MAG TPA: sugar phosphate nucleotidyltransferase, partial [Candidatus Rifleibacterium sp.]|nr:sugar phosphate nucleotidyltransferase [Candidatus Rifleibacterium sp.]